ncbi:hypothetical protein F7018_05410 [Tenacibaculum aiptasiae]|uniref:Uncharacterized protein n=1 Tax=Tenacibaculum aiptasiae TaxID=426481 RepID=A0A7J5AQB8_9FLAO|nr:hypothetical protein [Tenacibaculum aiptasiae]KAB1159747.1 hypothetical protein F7018_05410 [Tenacibaculum aiptasiae]
MDETFGVLIFKKSNSLGGSYWNVNRKVDSVNEIIEFYVYNNEHGISKIQKELIFKIEKKYPELLDNLENYLNAKIREVDSKSSKISILKDLDISFINIPENPTKLSKWEINFVEKRGFAIYEIEIENWKPIDLGISA